jgi:hypothetical protein
MIAGRREAGEIVFDLSNVRSFWYNTLHIA